MFSVLFSYPNTSQSQLIQMTFYCIPFHMSSCIHTSTPHA